MIYIFKNGSIVYDEATITDEQKENAIAVNELPIAEERDGMYAQIRADIEKGELYFDYFEIIEEVIEEEIIESVPNLPTEMERIEALEQAMLNIMMGGL